MTSTALLRTLGAALVLGATAASPAVAAPVFLTPDTPYASAADSPFAGAGLEYFHLEDFEDGLVDAPGLTAIGGGLSGAPRGNIDSVDGDDGTLDGENTAAAGNSYWIILGTTVAFTFTPTTLGALPTHAGLVWTDGGDNDLPQGRTGTYRFEAFGAGGEALGAVERSLGDDRFTGETGEDRFLGVIYEGGISRIVLSYLDAPATPYFEVDHVQFGGPLPVPVPLPAAAPLFLAALAGLGLRRARGGGVVRPARRAGSAAARTRPRSTPRPRR